MRISMKLSVCLSERAIYCIIWVLLLSPSEYMIASMTMSEYDCEYESSVQAWLRCTGMKMNKYEHDC